MKQSGSMSKSPQRRRALLWPSTEESIPHIQIPKEKFFDKSKSSMTTPSIKMNQPTRLSSQRMMQHLAGQKSLAQS